MAFPQRSRSRKQNPGGYIWQNGRPDETVAFASLSHIRSRPFRFQIPPSRLLPPPNWVTLHMVVTSVLNVCRELIPPRGSWNFFRSTVVFLLIVSPRNSPRTWQLIRIFGEEEGLCSRWTVPSRRQGVSPTIQPRASSDEGLDRPDCSRQFVTAPGRRPRLLLRWHRRRCRQR